MPITLGAASVVKVNRSSASGWSGGSVASASDTSAATTVTVHVAFAGRSDAGSRTNVVAGPAPVVFAKGTGVAPGQVSAKACGVTVTGSLKVTEMFASVVTFDAPAAGARALTAGRASTLNGRSRSTTRRCW